MMISQLAPVIVKLTVAAWRARATGAFLELFISPVLGGLSDTFGRKLVLMGNPGLLITLHSLVGFFPNLLWVNFIDR